MLGCHEAPRPVNDPQVGLQAAAALLLMDHEHTGDPAAIRCAFRRLALTQHPDKGGDAHYFRSMRLAHDVLLAHCTTGRQPGPFDCAALVEAIAPFAAVMTLLAARLAAERAGMKAPPVRAQVRLTLEDVVERQKKLVQLRVLRLGANTPQRQVVVLQPPDPEALFDAADQSTKLTFTYPSAGDDSWFSDCERGDATLEAHLEAHPVYELDRVVDPLDIHATVEVSVRDYYYGRDVRLPRLGPSYPELVVHYGRSSLDEQQPFRTRTASSISIPGKGILSADGTRVGNMYVFFDLVLPDLARETLERTAVRLFFEVLFGLFSRRDGTRL